MAITTDVLVVGGGILGLWVAKRAIDAGLDVVLVEANVCGGGASATPLGALLPHLPGRMTPKRQFQFDALLSLPDVVARLEAETGRSTGFARCGRLMPVRRAGFRERALGAIEAAAHGWRTGETGLRIELCPSSAYSHWMSPEAAPMGVLFDTLSARIDAGAYAAALAAAVRASHRILEGTAVTAFDPATQRARLTNASADVICRHLVVAAGFGSFPLLESIVGVRLGSGVKGQALLAELPAPVSGPIIYDDGVYIVPRAPTRVAIGSTTERQWTSPDEADRPVCEQLLCKARRLCPALENATIVRTWAGVRPRSTTGDPIIGALDPHKRVLAASGGYKITLGIAHRLADALIDMITDHHTGVPLPDSFKADRHLAAAARKPIDS